MDLRLFVLFVCAMCVQAQDQGIGGIYRRSPRYGGINRRSPVFGTGHALAGRFTVRVDGDCMCMVYEVYCQQPDDNRPYFHAAENHCVEVSISPHGPKGRLAILRNSTIDSMVRDFIKTNNFHQPPCITRHGFWIGLLDHLEEGKFVWSDGGALCQDDFRNWAPGEPNNNVNKDPNGQGCVQLWYRFGHDGLWDDDYCDVNPKGFVCEIPDPYCLSLQTSASG